MLKTIVRAIVFSLLLGACTAEIPKKHQDAINHIVAIDRDGNGMPIIAGKAVDEKAGERIQRQRLSGSCDVVDPTPQHFAEIFANIKTHAPVNSEGLKQILIYVHGGLNTLRSSLGRVTESVQVYENAQCKEKPRYKAILENGQVYPIFVIWRSGAFTTYGDHLARQREGRASSTAPLTSPLYFLTDVLASVVNAPKAWTVTGRHSLRATINRSETDKRLLDVPREESSFFYTGEGTDVAGTKLRTAKWILTSPAKVVTTPFVYTMAKPAWDVMEQRTRTQFRKPVEYEEKDDFPDACYDFKDPQGSGALAVFMRSLREFIKEQECEDGHCTKKYDITLIGHSMGAMVLDELVRTNPDMDFTNIVFMGAAVSARRVVENIVPYLERNPGTRFYNLSLHPENEDREASAAGLTPSGSLPVWIDTMYTTPESDLDKTAGRWSNMRVVRHVFPKETYESQMRFKVFGLDKNRHPQAHGDFDNFPFWQREFWWKPDRAYRCESGD